MDTFRMLLRALALVTVGLSAPARAQAQDPNGFRGLPSMICVDRRTTDLCKETRRLGAGKLETLRAAMPEVPFVPMIACELPDSKGPCSRAACGDEVCAFGEAGQCPLDCPVPAKLDLCLCDKPGAACRAYRVECDVQGCRSTPVAAEGGVCGCSGPEGTQQCKAEPEAVCQSMRFEKPIVGCELVRHRLGAKRSFLRCTNQSCPPVGFGLADDELPVVERTRVEGAKE